jgi:2-polyprenyl-3-methyl-5-hydroxy-6-metoxy-1,4-benzoquinol methylase
MELYRFIKKTLRKFRSRHYFICDFSARKEYRDLIEKIRKSSPVWGSHQTIMFPDGFILKGGRDDSRMRLLGLPDDFKRASVLDIGCNIGAISIECKKRNAGKVVGIDKDQNLVDCAREIARIFNFDINYRVFDIRKDTLYENFDYVFLLNVFHHLKEEYKIKVLRNLDMITRKKLFFEASVKGDLISKTYLKTEDYISYLKGFTSFRRIHILGKSDFNRPVISCEK